MSLDMRWEMSWDVSQNMSQEMSQDMGIDFNEVFLHVISCALPILEHAWSIAEGI
jgi:hypothetical protein